MFLLLKTWDVVSWNLHRVLETLDKQSCTWQSVVVQMPTAAFKAARDSMPFEPPEQFLGHSWSVSTALFRHLLTSHMLQAFEQFIACIGRPSLRVSDATANHRWRSHIWSYLSFVLWAWTVQRCYHVCCRKISCSIPCLQMRSTHNDQGLDWTPTTAFLWADCPQVIPCATQGLCVAKIDT